MNLVEINGFREDMQAGDIVTILLVDGEQVTGKILKIRDTAVKIAPESPDGPPFIVYSFEDVRRYAPGRENLLKTAQTSRNNSAIILPQPKFILDEPKPVALNSEKILRDAVSSIEEKIKLSRPDNEIKPEFKLDSVKLKFLEENELRKIMDQARACYENAIKLSEMNRLDAAINNMLAKNRQFPQIGALHALLGAFLWLRDRKQEAVTPLKIAAHLSGAPRDWKNLYFASVDNAELAFVALDKFFESCGAKFIPMQNDWYCYLRMAWGAGLPGAALSRLAKIATQKLDEEHQKMLAQSLIFILAKNGMADEARKYALSLAEGNLSGAFFVEEANNCIALFDKTRESEKIRDIEYDMKYEVESLNEAADNEERLENVELVGASGFKQRSDHFGNYFPTDPIRHSGKIQSYGPTAYGYSGKIKDDQDGRIYTFQERNVEDSVLESRLRKNIFSDQVYFYLGTNSYGKIFARRLNSGESDPQKELQVKIQQATVAGRYNEVIELCESGIKIYPRNPVFRLTVAQRYSAMGKLEKAADAYKHLIDIEEKSAARKNATIMYIQLLYQLGQWEEALKNCSQLLDAYPNDEYLKRFYSTISFAKSQAKVAGEDVKTMASRAYFSEFMEAEIEEAQFYDDAIVKKGGKPSPEDAERLKKVALEARGANRFYSSLEAAKAFKSLPSGSYEWNDLILCLVNYAMQKGEWLVAQMRGLASTSEEAKNSAEKLLILSDSAASYFIEALQWLNRDMTSTVGGDRTVNLDDIIADIIRNYLHSVLINFYSTHPDKYDRSLLDSNFKQTFGMMLEPGTEYFPIVCESFITWGSYRSIWSNICQVSGGPGALTDKMRSQTFRTAIKSQFENIIGTSITKNLPKEILAEAFTYRQRERDALHKSFREIANCHEPDSYEYFNALSGQLKSFPLDNRALPESDRNRLKKIKNILAGMASYKEKTTSDADRTEILVRSRQKFNELLPREEDSPTYWRKVGCEPVIRKCIQCIEKLEEIRTRDRKPKIDVILDPPVFTRGKDGMLRTTVRAHNRGLASATDCKLYYRLRVEDMDLYTSFLDMGRLEFHNEVEKELALPASKLKNISAGDAILEIEAEYFEDDRKKALIITFEEDSGATFVETDIPWDYNKEASSQTFKGRDAILDNLVKNLDDPAGRASTYMLYGVTRSGKSSILKFLRGKLHGKAVPNDPAHRCFFCVNWAFNEVANVAPAQDFGDVSTFNAVWDNFLHSSMLESVTNPTVDNPTYHDFDIVKDLLKNILEEEKPASGEKWQSFVEKLNSYSIYPVYLIDEFSYFKELHEKKLLGPAFLSVMRQLALEDKASFVIAGTYDILELINDRRYGITGQFANLQRIPVTSIEPEPARELVDIFNASLKFTETARQRILDISDCRPFLIQTLCRNCAYYALDNKRSIIGATELEQVVSMLTGVKSTYRIPKMESGKFANNLVFPNEKNARVYSAITTLLSIKSQERGKYLSYKSMKEIWEGRDLPTKALADALVALKERGVVEEIMDEGERVYKLKVPLFSRWWANEHPDLDIELDQARG